MSVDHIEHRSRYAAQLLLLGLSSGVTGCALAPLTHTPHRVLDLRYGSFPCNTDTVDKILATPPCPAFLDNAQRLTMDLNGAESGRVTARSAELTITVEPTASQSSVSLGMDFSYAVNEETHHLTTRLTAPYGQWIAISGSYNELTVANAQRTRAEAVFLRIDESRD